MISCRKCYSLTSDTLLVSSFSSGSWNNTLKQTLNYVQVLR